MSNPIFFSKNRITAIKRLKQLQKEDKYYKRYKGVKLARKQISTSSCWKTWELY